MQDDEERVYVTHAVLETINPTFCFEFEMAKVMYGAMSDTGKNIVAVFDDESRKDYGSPDINGMNKLWMTIDAVKGLQPVICGIEAASSQTICINGMQEAVPQIPYFPENRSDMMKIQG